jgi:hypothetical protein
LFWCYTHANPRPPTPETGEILILFALPRRFFEMQDIVIQFFLPE